MVNSSRPDELVDGVFGRLASHVLPLYWLLLGLLGISNVLLGQGRGVEKVERRAEGCPVQHWQGWYLEPL